MLACFTLNKCMSIHHFQIFLPSNQSQMRVSLSVLLCVSFADGAMVSTTSSHALPASFAQTRGWTERPSALCGASCKTARRIHSASCLDRLFVAWTAHDGWTPSPQYEGYLDEQTSGFVTEFKIDSATRTSTVISSKRFSWCNEMGEIFASPDCGLVAALCRSPKEAAEVPGAIDWVSKTQTEHGEQFGWYQESNTDVNGGKYRLVDQVTHCRVGTVCRVVHAAMKSEMADEVYVFCPPVSL